MKHVNCNIKRAWEKEKSIYEEKYMIVSLLTTDYFQSWYSVCTIRNYLSVDVLGSLYTVCVTVNLIALHLYFKSLKSGQHSAYRKKEPV